ncbi:MAG: ParB/RepB/Spo0J family partition protein [Proteobacteria bacterium]|nr:ParB/RepB/Spo0J family partition protein [Pseudomonadota bacterium]
MAKHGLLHPVVVNGSEDSKLVVLDGFKRLTVLREQEQSEVWVRVMHLPEAAAQAAILTYNAGNRGGLSELQEGLVIQSLVRGCKLQQKQVAELVGRHKSWVSRRLLLVEQLCESVQKDLRVGLVSPMVAREVAQLPRGNQARVVQVVRDNGLTSRQAAELCTMHRAANNGQMGQKALEELLDDPVRFLDRADDKPKSEPRDPRLSEIGERIRRRLVRFDQACCALRYILNRYSVPSLRTSDRRVLAPMGDEIGERGRRVVERLIELAEAERERTVGPDESERSVEEPEIEMPIE